MLKIRLRRMGSTHRPFYRLVVADSRRVPTSSAIEEVGYYDPGQDPKVLEVKTERVDHWVNQGAQLSPAVRRLVKQARRQPAEAVPTKDEAKPKAKAKAAAPEEPKVEEPKVEEPKVEEPKVEEPKVEEPKAEAEESKAEAEESKAEAEEAEAETAEAAQA